MATLSQLPDLSPNRQAFPLVQELIAKRELLGIEVFRQDGVTVIDCGVHVQGSWDAGVLFAGVCLGGLAQVTLDWLDFDGLSWLAVEVDTVYPIRACLASQYAGWPINYDKNVAMGSGPGRAIIHKGKLFETLGYEDHSEIAILCLESERLPTEAIVHQLLEEFQCKPANLYILVSPTASQVGSAQIAARALETGLSKLMELGYNLENIESGRGVCPLPPVASDNLSALGCSNDAILYGSTVLFNLRDEDISLATLVKEIPFCSSREYGRLFSEVYKGDFYDLDPLIFSPAEVWLCNLKSGRSFHAGVLRPDILSRSFGLS